MPKLLVEHLTLQFPTRDQPLVVLRDVTLEAHDGESLAVVGPSGSGKSTLLSILGTLLPPSGGRVTLDGQDPFQLPEPQLAAFRNRRIGFVFQDHYLLPQCTLLENVLVPAVAAGAIGPQTVRRAEMLLEPRRTGRSTRLSPGRTLRGPTAAGRPGPRPHSSPRPPPGR